MGERIRELLVLLLGDISCFLAAVWLTLFVRYFTVPSQELLSAHVTPFLMLTILWIVVFLAAGLYDKHTTLLKQTLRNRIIYTQIANMVLAVIVFLSIPLGIAPKTNLVIYLLISTGLLSWWRLVGFNFFTPKHRLRAVLIADGEEAIELADEINNNDRYNYSFVRIIGSELAADTQFESKLLSLIESEQIQIIVVSRESAQAAKVMPTLFELSFLNFQSIFIDFTTLYEDTFDKVPLSVLGHDWFVTHVSQSKNPLYDLIKRLTDIVGVMILALPTLCVLPFVALAIKLDDGGPLFYFTERVGKHNKPIKIYKFRTKNGRDAGTQAMSSTLVDTRVGAFLRKTRLDELPQLFNVLKGDLSFIGPRPEMPALAAVYAEQIPYYNARHFITPGLSGWAQINDLDAPRGGVDIERTKSKVSYDLLYMKRRSLLLDLQIAIKTLATLVRRTGT